MRHHGGMNSINRILSGLCSSLLLSVNCEKAASTLMLFGCRADGVHSLENFRSEVAPVPTCLPCSVTEQ